MFIRQYSDQIVDVARWTTDEHAIYAEGSRPKSTVISSDAPEYLFLRSNHRYLFKRSAPRYPTQFWAEVVAYRIGMHLGVRVPPTFVACNSTAEPRQYGALIEWFYTDRGTSGAAERYVSGGQYMRRMIPDFDTKKGRQHNLDAVLRVARGLFRTGTLTENPVITWAPYLMFDALIGNQDRHQDNWGLVFTPASEPKIRARLAPAFDNGTSLGHEIIEARIDQLLEPERLARYIDNGHHHMKWTLESDRQAGHFELVAKILTRWPELRPLLREMLALDWSILHKDLLELAEFTLPDPYRLTPARINLMWILLLARRDRLRMLLQ